MMLNGCSARILLFLALVCGADTVMLGSALSGTDEAPGRVIEDPATHTKKKIYHIECNLSHTSCLIIYHAQ